MPDEQQHSLFLVSSVDTPEPSRVPEDAAARAAAIDTTRSILVQAPAGAGKTSLLTQRFLALLAEVDEPEQILAITFTRAATAEMRHRILTALESARTHPAPVEGESEERRLARSALRHADSLGWQLLEQPHRLDVQTIDSLCLRLAHAQPLLARLGGALQPADNDKALYAVAARRTAALLGDRADADLEAALERLLLRRDNNLPEVERLLAEMLANRSAWLGVLPLASFDAIDWEAVREKLEQPFADAHRRVLGALACVADAVPDLHNEWLALARYAVGNLDTPTLDGCDLSVLLSDRDFNPQDRDCWLALASILLKRDGDHRASWDKRHGFPAPGDGPGKQQRRQFKDRIKACSDELQALVSGSDSLQQLLCQLRSLPAARYTEDQWQTLRAAFLVLRRATAELRLIFAENNAVDFVEIAQAAEQVLRDETTMRGLLESEQRRHLLIDEFQDTSRAQYRLVAELMKEWRTGDGRSIFLVGDPLQSIYSFRQAEVALFHETRDHGLPCGDRRHPCHTLQLTHNFRSHRILVDALNQSLARVFPLDGADRFVPASAWPSETNEDNLHLHTSFSVDTQSTSRGDETAAVLDILEAELPRIAAAQARGDEQYRVAVLVNSRTHLAHITHALRERHIAFRAVDLEPLADRQEVHDLHMLLRALLHPGERIAWLSVLRAPWCGLSLDDLHLLAGADDRTLLKRPLAELIATRGDQLSPDGQARLQRTWRVLESALRTRYDEDNNTSLATWLERTWTALGGSACVDANTHENADAFFRLLDELEPSGVEVLRGDFALRLAKLCAAPDPRVSERFGIQLMTMHKAKGLGFEVVLLPGLDRATRGRGSDLLAMLERTRPGVPLESELLLAPIGNREDEDADPTYAWVQSQRQAQINDERRRLFYVACTRARNRLHLFATITVTNGNLRRPAAGSLLHAAWPAFSGDIEQRAAQLPAASTGLALAASIEAAPAYPPNILPRLPSGWRPQPAAPGIVSRRQAPRQPLFTRSSSGGLLARARGNAVHAVLERMTRLFAEEPATPDAGRWQRLLEQTAQRALRAGGYAHPALQATARAAAHTALSVAASSVGRWLLHPHPGALAESAWQVWDSDGNLRTLRVDRSFRAGDAPALPGDHCLWIIDYKTGAASQGDCAAWLAQQKEQWRGQLEAYGNALTSVRQGPQDKPRSLRYGLYFPELLELVDWPQEETEAQRKRF